MYRSIKDLNQYFGNLTIYLAVFYDNYLYSRFHQVEYELIKWIVATMKTVQMKYDQQSVKNFVNVNFIITKIEQVNIEIPEPGLVNVYLTKFCEYQSQSLNSQNNSVEWDFAILLTGINLWQKPKDKVSSLIVGVAYPGTICTDYTSERRCALIEVKSFQATLTATHEIGHALGMRHDGRYETMLCDKEKNIMSATTGAGKTKWSQCSLDDLKRHLLRIKRLNPSCLDFSKLDTVAYKSIDLRSGELPGVTYPSKKQCDFYLGHEYYAYSGSEPPYDVRK
ncbi:disintegrin and metalloproteinase with thrombospondin motifs 18-like protein [Dinothrombium tinctorium]|uniref:Disintegrin and metalloproteinase with thrombospondin motifs 18-like protein n=1 Tax=Dinothrombium tinctorium TaxID=1965070 RepID=A0A3S3NNL3_9ACAR|nr:disintegrin and metalloproteinase with thrombospondin motifs 18-like protein [Dinothrombium tinctorium]RWS03038.1 disintegrin and metalloproteinase with thrombospondin motifs 18-like protein [Dinothrombium tinctorium]RWS03081.1 disintegrin and metalloproteinase with thrombospondin motifs 18-like protein [Dinothrombium tinctorium]